MLKKIKDEELSREITQVAWIKAWKKPWIKSHQNAHVGNLLWVEQTIETSGFRALAAPIGAAGKNAPL